MTGLVLLRNGAATATIARRGAELRQCALDGHDLLWTPDPAIWTDTAPLLFPVVGWTREGIVRVDGRVYPLGLHGFARAMPFIVSEWGADWVRLALTSSPRTRALYPFDFVLSVTYRLSAKALRTELCIRNIGSTPLPYACGLHPGFRCPFAGGALDDYAIVFEEEERASVPVIAADGLFTRERRSVPLRGRRLGLSPETFAREALCFLDARSRRLSLVHRGGAAIGIELEGFPHIALWSRPGGGFVSVEAWTGHGDFVDSDGDLWSKPSMISLAPGGVGWHAATYLVTAGADFGAGGDRCFPRDTPTET